MKGLFLLLTVLLLSAGCRLVGPSAETRLGITALELRERSQHALDPQQKLENVHSFELVQEVESFGKKFFGGVKNSKSLEITRYRSPFYVCIIQYLQKNSIERLVSNPRGTWQVDTLGKIKKITDERQKAAFDFTVAELNPKTTDTELWSRFELQESNLNPDSWYCLVLYPKGSAIRKRTCYIEKSTYLPRRIETDYGYQKSITEITEYRRTVGVMMPYKTVNTTIDGKTESIRTLVALRLNCLPPECICDFEPETPLTTTLPGCKACGPEPKPRKIYVPESHKRK